MGAIACGRNCHGRICHGRNWLWAQFTGRNCLGRNCLGRNCHGRNCLWAQFTGRNCLWAQLPWAQLPWNLLKYKQYLLYTLLYCIKYLLVYLKFLLHYFMRRFRFFLYFVHTYTLKWGWRCEMRTFFLIKRNANFKWDNAIHKYIGEIGLVILCRYKKYIKNHKHFIYLYYITTVKSRFYVIVGQHHMQR